MTRFSSSSYGQGESYLGEVEISQSHKKSYTDVRRMELEFEIDNFLCLKISPMMDVIKFSKKGKNNPNVRFYRISKRIGKVANELDLPQELAAVHLVFHISMLKKCIADPSFIVLT